MTAGTTPEYLPRTSLDTLLHEVGHGRAPALIEKRKADILLTNRLRTFVVSCSASDCGSPYREPP